MIDLVALLLSLILAATGIPRDVDPNLSALAERRAVEISACDACFSHDGWILGTSEVLAWNISPDPATTALGQWQGSPPHWAILTDPTLNAIGCGHAQTEGRHYFACVLVGRPVAVPAPPALVPVATEPTPSPPVRLLPDAAMRTP